MNSYALIALIALFALSVVTAWSIKVRKGRRRVEDKATVNPAQLTIKPTPPLEETPPLAIKPGEAWSAFKKIDEDYLFDDVDISCYNPIHDGDSRGSISHYAPNNGHRTAPDKPASSIRFTHSGVLNGYTYHSLLTYYPKNKYKEAPADVIKDRNTVYGFKDGMGWKKVADSLHDALVNEYPLKHKNWRPSNVVFVIIPSSTRQKTNLRYMCLCDHVSTRLGIANGFKAICVREDRAALKGKVGVNKTANLNYDKSLVVNKYVILFDDVKTSGESFLQNADKLMSLGAKNVRGVFLGETYDSKNNGEPAWVFAETSDLPF